MDIDLDVHSLLHEQISSFANQSYHDYTPLGISFCFDNRTHLTSLDLCAPIFPTSIPLPRGLRLGMTGKDLVMLLGEPDRKGGGGGTRLDCWIEYSMHRASTLTLRGPIGKRRIWLSRASQCSRNRGFL